MQPLSALVTFKTTLAPVSPSSAHIASMAAHNRRDITPPALASG